MWSLLKRSETATTTTTATTAAERKPPPPLNKVSSTTPQPSPASSPPPLARLSDVYESTFPAMRLYAADAIALAPPMDATSVVHDNGCGPGVVAAEVLARCRAHGAAPPRIEASDISPAMTSAAAQRGPEITAQVMDSRVLAGYPDDVFTHSFSAFVVLGMSTADAARVVAEMRRTLRPGGAAVLSAWSALEYLDVFEAVAQAVNPGAALHTAAAVVSERRLRQILALGGFPSPAVDDDHSHEPADSSHDGSHDSSHGSALVRLESITRCFPWALWTDPVYVPIRRQMCQSYTGEGWAREDVDRLDHLLANRIACLAEEGRSYQMTAWIAVMVK